MTNPDPARWPIAGVAEAALPDRMVASLAGWAHRVHEPILGRVPELIDRRRTAVDVGAWYGPWTRRLARHARSVVTVEADPTLAAFVARTAPANVTVVPKAASDAAGTATLWLPPGGPAGRGRASLRNHVSSTGVEVETIRLDSLDLVDVGLLKIDIEGHEYPALLGAEKLVRRWQPTVIVELEEAHAPTAPVLALLAEWGYTGWYFQHRRWHPLAGFDLISHQSAMAPQLGHGYVGSLVRGTGRRYVNTILFRPPTTAR